MFGYGVGYAIASLSCTVGPFLAVTGAGVGGTSASGRVWIYVAYAAGFALVVGALAVAVALAGSALVDRMRRILPYVNRIGGAVLILVGLYVGYYGYYEIRLFTAGGNPADPVIAAAGRLQGAIAGWVHRHGAWPWILLLAVLLAGRDRVGLARERWHYFETVDGPVQIGPRRATNHSQRGEGRGDQPDQLAHQRYPRRIDRGHPGRLAVLDDEHTHRFRGEAQIRVLRARLGPAAHFGDRQHRHTVHGFVRLPVNLRGRRVRHDRVEGISKLH